MKLCFRLAVVLLLTLPMLAVSAQARDGNRRGRDDHRWRRAERHRDRDHDRGKRDHRWRGHDRDRSRRDHDRDRWRGDRWRYRNDAWGWRQNDRRGWRNCSSLPPRLARKYGCRPVYYQNRYQRYPHGYRSEHPFGFSQQLWPYY